MTLLDVAVLDPCRAAAARPALPGDRDADVAIVGAGYTGLWTAYYLAKADPSLRIVVLEARDRRVRRQSAATVAGARRCSPSVARARPPHGRDAAPSRCTARCSRQSTRSGGSRPPRASTATTPRAARSSSRARRSSSPAPGRRSPRRGSSASARTTCACWARPRRRARSARPTCSAARTRRTARRSTRRSWCAAWPRAVERLGVRIHERHPVTRDRARRARDTPHGTVRAPSRGPRHRGLHADAARAAPGDRARLLAHARHRAAAGVVLGRRSGWRGGRPSPTTGT